MIHTASVEDSYSSKKHKSISKQRQFCTWFPDWPLISGINAGGPRADFWTDSSRFHEPPPPPPWLSPSRTEVFFFFFFCSYLQPRPHPAVAPPTDWTVYVPVSFRKCISNAPLCFISSFKSLVCLEKGSCLQVTKWAIGCRGAFKHDIKQDILLITYRQFWGKLLLKIMHYNIALPLKK